MKTDTKALVLVVQVEESYGSHKVRAYVGTDLPEDRQSDTDRTPRISTPSWRDYQSRNGQQYDGFRIQAYLGSSLGMSTVDSEKGLWGFGFQYEPSMIDDPEFAREIAKVLVKVKTGLEKINDTDGYVPNDFGIYIMRVARILGITRVYFRNDKERLARTGDWARKVDGTTLQWALKEVVEKFQSGKVYELLNR